MTTITNTLRRKVALPGDSTLFLDAGETKSISDEQLAGLKRHRINRQHIEKGSLVVEGGKVATKVTARIKSGSMEKTAGVKLPDGITGKGVEIEEKGGGWCHVWVNGMQVTDSAVRKPRAEEIAAEYK